MTSSVLNPLRSDAITAGNAGHGSVLAAYGNDCARLLETCDLRGQFFKLKGLWVSYEAETETIRRSDLGRREAAMDAAGGRSTV